MAFIAYIDEYSAQKVVSLGHDGVLKDVMLSYLIERPSYTRS
jgi:hypothetical protein